MALPAGIWKANVNGREADFAIQSVEEGRFTATLLGKTFEGFWDEVSQTITFSFTGVLRPPPEPPAIALFKGYLFRTPENPAPGRDVVATLSGSAQVTGVAEALPGTARRNVFGWFAQITEVV